MKNTFGFRSLDVNAINKYKNKKKSERLSPEADYLNRYLPESAPKWDPEADAILTTHSQSNHSINYKKENPGVVSLIAKSLRVVGVCHQKLLPIPPASNSS